MDERREEGASQIDHLPSILKSSIDFNNLIHRHKNAQETLRIQKKRMNKMQSSVHSKQLNPYNHSPKNDTSIYDAKETLKFKLIVNQNKKEKGNHDNYCHNKQDMINIINMCCIKKNNENTRYLESNIGQTARFRDPFSINEYEKIKNSLIEKQINAVRSLSVDIKMKMISEIKFTEKQTLRQKSSSKSILAQINNSFLKPPQEFENSGYYNGKGQRHNVPPYRNRRNQQKVDEFLNNESSVLVMNHSKDSFQAKDLENDVFKQQEKEYGFQFIEPQWNDKALETQIQRQASETNQKSANTSNSHNFFGLQGGESIKTQYFGTIDGNIKGEGESGMRKQHKLQPLDFQVLNPWQDIPQHYQNTVSEISPVN